MPETNHQDLDKIINQKMGDYADADKNLAKEQLLDFLALASDIIINNQSRLQRLDKEQ